jgi:hypothetical protein
LIGDAQRTEVLCKARALSEASQALTKAVLKTYVMPTAASRRRQQREAQAQGLGLGLGLGLEKGDSNPFSSLRERYVHACMRRWWGMCAINAWVPCMHACMDEWINGWAE